MIFSLIVILEIISVLQQFGVHPIVLADQIDFSSSGLNTDHALKAVSNILSSQLIVKSVGDGKFSASTDILAKFNSLNISQIYSPIPSIFNDDLNTVENIVTDIMNVGSSLAQIISVLLSSTSLNSQIKNTTVATLLNQQLQPFRTSNSFKKFFDSYNADPLFYNTIFTMFSSLNGSTAVVLSVINELKTTPIGLSSSQVNSINERYNILASQDYSFFTNEKFSCDNLWIVEFGNYLQNSSLNDLASIVNLLDKNSQALCQIKINNATSSSLKLDAFNRLKNSLLKSNNLFNNLVNISNNSALKSANLLSLNDILPYLTCNVLAKLSNYQEIVSNLTVLKSLDTASLERILQCNLPFTLFTFDSYKLNRALLPEYQSKLITNYFMKYKFLLGQTNNFADYGQFLQDTPQDRFESLLIFNYLLGDDANALNYAILINWFNSLNHFNISYNSLNTEIKSVTQKYIVQFFKSKVNETWTDDIWTLFQPVSQSFDFNTFSFYLESTKKYVEFINRFTSKYPVSQWQSNCGYTNNLYAFYLYIKKSYNDTTNINMANVNKMISCKVDCDFSDWITDNSSITEIRTLISNFFPYLSSSSKQLCKSTTIVQSIRKIISDLNNVTQADVQLVVDTGFSLNTLFTSKEIANLSPSVLSTFKSSIVDMQFDRETARIILSKLFNISSPTDIKLSQIKNLIVGLDTRTLSLLNVTDIRENINLIVSSLGDNVDYFFKYILITKYFNGEYTRDLILNLFGLGRRDLNDFVTLSIVKSSRPEITFKDIQNLSIATIPPAIITYLTIQYIKTKPIETWTLADLQLLGSDILSTLSPLQVKTLIDNNGLDAIRILANKNSGLALTQAVTKQIVAGLRATLIKLYGSDVNVYIRNLPVDILDLLTDQSFAEFLPSEYDVLLKIPSIFEKIFQRIVNLSSSLLGSLPLFVSRTIAQLAVRYLQFNPSTEPLTQFQLDRLGYNIIKYIPFFKVQQINLFVLASRIERFQGIELLLDANELNSFRNILYDIFRYVFNNNINYTKSRFGSLYQLIAYLIPIPSPPVCTHYKICTGRWWWRRCRFYVSCYTPPYIFPSFHPPFFNIVVKPILNIFKPIFSIFGKRDLSSLRQTSSTRYTCSDIISMGPGVLLITSDEITNMNDNEFLNCLSVFNTYQNYDNNVTDAFKTKIMKSFNYNYQSQIKDQDILDMGYFSSFFTASEMSQWSITKMDTFASLGALDLNEFQIDSLGQKAKLLISNPISSFDIINMGNLVCGLNQTDLLSISKTSFETSLSTFSNLKGPGCNQQDFANLMSLAKQSFSNDLWTTYQLQDIRNLAAGLSLNDLTTKLNLELILSIEATAFEYMNKQVIEEILKTNQTLNYLSREQLSFIKSNQNYQQLMESLRTNVDNSYNGVLGNKFDIVNPNLVTAAPIYTISNNNGNNKCSIVTFSYNLLIISFILHFFP